jgi:hypothetical protein
MRRIVVFLTVWAMGLAGVLASVALPSSASAAAPTTAGAYVYLTPFRLLDTREGLGAPNAVVPAGGTIHLKVSDVGGVPTGVPTEVSAVVLNVTVVGPTSAGFITLSGGGTPRPVTSSLNFVKGQTVPNLVIAPVGTGGIVDLYNGSTGTVELVADVSGYFVAGAPIEAGTFGSLAPARLLDTRIGKGAPPATVRAGGTVHLKVTDVGGVPTGVSAVVLNVTVVAPAAAGYITVSDGGTVRPGTSSLNFVKGQTVPNLVIAPVGPGGIVDLYNGSTGTVGLLADVSGYYLPGTPIVIGSFGPLTPARLLDTRHGVGVAANTAVPARGTVHLKVTDVGRVPATRVSAVVLNVTVVTPATEGYITVSPGGAARPVTSSLNFVKAQTVPNLVIAEVGPGGIVDLYNGSNGTVQLLADVSGYCVAPDTTAPGPVTALTATPLTTSSVALTWVNPVDADFTAVTIRRALGTTAPATANDGTPVAVPPSPTATSFTDTGLAASTTYSYAVFAHDAVPNDAAGVNVTATTLTPPDTTAPGPVTTLTIPTVTTTSVALAWTNPTDADFTGVTIRRALGATAPATATDGTSVAVPVSATATSFTDTGLAFGTQYSYAVFAHDAVPNRAAGVNVTATTLTPPDVTAPGPVTGLTAVPTTLTTVQVRLAWTNPTDADFTGVMIRRAVGATAPATVLDGDLVVASTAKAATLYINEIGLAAGTQYSYAVFAHDGAFNYAAAATVTVITQVTPTAAVLMINGSSGTAKTSVNGFEPMFDVTGSHAGPGRTFVSGSLNYGDGNTETFVGDPATWIPFHSYQAVGTMTVTLQVTDSAGVAASDVITLTVYPAPIATITASSGPAQPGVPLTFALTSSTPAGTAFTDYDVSYGDGSPVAFVDGVPPATLTHTFVTAGTYTVTFEGYNDADGLVRSSTKVTFDVIAPGPVTALIAAVGTTSIGLAWVNPVDPDFTGVTIRRALGASAPLTVTDGTSVAVPLSATATSFTDAGLVVDTQYSYAVFAHDGALNHAAATTVTATTTVTPPDAVLMINGSTGATARSSVKGFEPLFDVTASHAGQGKTIVSGSLDYGDGTTDLFAGDPATWGPFHSYLAAGTVNVTLQVTDSAGGTVSDVVTLTVYPAPLATIIPSGGPARPGMPLTFALTSSTPAGTTFTDYAVSYGDGTPMEFADGLPPATLTHTFGAAGTYTVTFTAYNDADGFVSPSTQVTFDVTAPGPVTALSAAVTDTSVALGWVNPVDPDFTGVTIRRTVGASAPLTVADGTPVAVPASAIATSFIDTGLAPGTQYSYAVFAHDGALNHAAATDVSATTTGTPPDTTPPKPIYSFDSYAGGQTSSAIALRWSEVGISTDYTGLMIRRAVGATAPLTAMDGVLVTDGSKGAYAYIDHDLAASTTYSYAAFSHDGVPNYAAAKTWTASTLAPANTGPVTGLTSTVTPSSISLAWTNPAEAGFTGVTVCSQPGATPPPYPLAGSGTGTYVSCSDTTLTSYTDSVLIAGATYSYAVFAHDSLGSHAVAADLTATTAP